MKSINRTVKEGRSPYEKIDHRPLEDARLSYAARGVLGYLLTKPADWEIRFEDLFRREAPLFGRKTGKARLRAALRELKALGYLARIRVREVDGTFRWTTAVYETPLLNPHFSQIHPQTENQSLDFHTLD
ncbi:MAG: hypothetical protein AB1631_34515, partial [Acidobacteriota bacterium]